MKQALGSRDREAEPATKTIRSLHRGLRILNEIITAPRPVRLYEVVERFDIDKASAYRFLATLERYDMVTKNVEEKTYSVGGRLMSWLSSARPELVMMRCARPHLNRLVAETGHSGHLGVLSRRQVMLADYVPSANIVSVRHEVGTHEPLHCSAVGKAILAYLPKDDREQLLDALELKRRTPNTIVNRTAFARSLVEIRRAGWAFDDGENYEDVCCVGAPVLDERSYPRCSVGVSLVKGLIEREPERLPRIAKAVMTCTRAVEQDLLRWA